LKTKTSKSVQGIESIIQIPGLETYRIGGRSGARTQYVIAVRAG